MARGRRDVEKEQFWRLVLEEQQSSGLGVREFCRRESVSEPSFYAWRRELRRRDGDARPARQAAKPARKLIPVEVVDRSKVHPRAQQGAAMPAIEIVTPGGWRLRLAADIGPARLRAVLDVVAGRESAGPADARTERAPC